jgi:hypothetical protein
MNATHNDSAAGPNSLPVVATPRLAGATATWTSGTLGTTPANLRGLAFNGSRFVAVGDATTTGTVTTPTIFAGDFNYTNTNPLALGVTAWMAPVQPPPGFTSNLSSVIFSGGFGGTGAYFALGSDGSLISSADGLNWAVSNGPVLPAGMTGIAFGFINNTTSTYVAVGNGGKIYVTNDLLTWNPITPITTNDLTSVSVLNGKLVATGTNGSFVATGTGGTLLASGDGSNWVPLTSNTTNTLRGITFSAISGIYVAVGDAGTIITSADNGVTWNPVVPAPLAQDLRGVTTGGQAGTRFLAVGQGGAVVYSDDGLSWFSASAGSSNNLASVLVAPGMYFAVGDAGVNAVSK